MLRARYWQDGCSGLARCWAIAEELLRNNPELTSAGKLSVSITIPVLTETGVVKPHVQVWCDEWRRIRLPDNEEDCDLISLDARTPHTALSCGT